MNDNPLQKKQNHLRTMPFVVSATGPAGLPTTQAEVDARRAERLAKRVAGGSTVIGKKTKKPRKKK